MSRSQTAILHVAHQPVTGPWSVIRELAKSQESSGLYAAVGVGLITNRSWPAAYEHEIRENGLRCFRKRTPKMFGTGSFLLQYVRRPGIEAWAEELAGTCAASNVVVHFHNAWMSGVFLPFYEAARLRLSAVATVHGVNADFRGQPVRKAIHRWMARRLLEHRVQLTSVDRRNTHVAEEILGLPAKRFVVVPNGIAVSKVSGVPFLRGNEPFTVGFVGSLTPAKGWRIAVDAVRGLRARNRRIRLLLAGAGPDEQEVRSLARANPDCIEFVGFVSSPQTVVMPKLDVLAVMSEREGLPMVIIEAMSAGVPVIATNVGGIPEAIVEGESGFLVERSTQNLAGALQALYDSPSTLLRLSQRTKEIFRERFEIGAVVDRYHAVYTAPYGFSPDL